MARLTNLILLLEDDLDENLHRHSGETKSQTVSNNVNKTMKKKSATS